MDIDRGYDGIQIDGSIGISGSRSLDIFRFNLDLWRLDIFQILLIVVVRIIATRCLIKFYFLLARVYLYANIYIYILRN